MQYINIDKNYIAFNVIGQLCADQASFTDSMPSYLRVAWSMLVGFSFLYLHYKISALM